MKLAIVYSRASSGISAPLVTVEAHLSNGMAGFHIVGLPETAVKESKERVRSAILNTHFNFPSKRITINLAPADLPKEGGRFDLPIALGILAASGQLPGDKFSSFEFTGELALSGELRAVQGVLSVVLAASHVNRSLVIPKQNSEEASVVNKANIFAASHLLDVCAFIKGESSLEQCIAPPLLFDQQILDLSDVKGQPHAKRALTIAAAGRHSLLFVGPPGTGKTMLASRLITILPPLNEIEALEAAAVASISKEGFSAKNWRKTPFRSPHHSSSSTALVGGGRPPRPGEISLAHHGILFLDELTEFKRDVLESLREPLESNMITISRAAHQATFPANFQLIAAMNPCPCGLKGIENEYCQCSDTQIKRYLAKISGPFLDRIDMQVEVSRLPAELLNKMPLGKESFHLQNEVARVRKQQWARQGKHNAYLTGVELEKVCQLSVSCQNFMVKLMNKFNFSARVYHRLLKIGRTIADLLEEEKVSEKHLAEAVQLRIFDHKKII